VKDDGCHGPRRLPPSRGSPRTDRSRDRLRHPNRSTSFADASLPAMARPPSPTPAATEVASLGQMLLDGFCNQDGIRGAPREHHDLTRTATARDSLRVGHRDRPAMSRACPWPEPRGAPVEAPRTGRVTREPACTQQCRGRLSNARAPHSSPNAAPLAWNVSDDGTPPRLSLGAGPRERNQHRRVPGCLPPPRGPRGCNSPRVVLVHE
jgi:hypothetical protein